MPRTTTASPRSTAPRHQPRRLVAAGAVVVLATGATAACAVVGLDQAAPLADPVGAPAEVPAASESSSAYTQVPLPQGVSLWHKPLPEGQSVFFAVDRRGDDVTTAKVGMGGPRCFFGVAQDGVLQGRYRVITAGNGLDQQADPVRVKVTGDAIVLTERATGTVIGEYVLIDPADTEDVAAAQAALDACGAVRGAPATATPR